MLTVPIHQDISSVPLMATPIIDLTISQPVSTTVSKSVDEIVTNAVDWAIQAPLRDRFRDLPEADMKEILHHRMWESNSYKAHEDHKKLYEALEKSMNRDHTDQLLTNLAEAQKKKKKRHDSLKTPPWSPPHQPPPPLPPAATLAEYTAWTTTDTRLKPPVSSIPEDLHMDDDTAPDEQVHSSGDEDIGHDHIPTVNLKQNWWKPLTEDIPATPKPAWSIPSSDFPVPMNNWASALASTYAKLQPKNLVLYAELATLVGVGRLFYVPVLTKASGLLNLNNRPGKGPAYNNFKVHPSKLVVPNDNYTNINRHIYEGDRRAVRTHMRILSVVRIKVFSLYGYDYMKTIILCRADLNEYIITERDFKYLYPSNFKDLYLLNLQGHMNHLPPKDKKILSTTVNLWIRNLVIRQRVEDFQLGIESYQTQLNLTKPRWDATGFEFKHDFTVIDSLRAITFRDKYGVQMIMRFNEIHKFSDDTLQQIDEALDYWVKEFRTTVINPGL
ncbi:hypothetical protein Tco_0362985 [Tanacetum coccineum]